MMRPQPMVVLADVPAGAKWFESVLGLHPAHGGSEYEMLTDGDELVAQLHEWDAHEHPAMGDPQDPSRGNGILLWFSTDDFDAVLSRVADHAATVVDGPLTNPNSHLREVWLRGPEGYTVVVAGP
jgi:predicted enzyme related to lactoylglutathione lyase